jgi:hypothetical protein
MNSNLTMGRVRVTIVAVEKQLVLHNLYVSVALGIKHATRMRHVVTYGLPRSTIFFRVIS